MSENNPLKSSYTPIVTVNQGNGYKLIDPNPIGEIVPHEDLFNYVSLVAYQKSRSMLTVDEGKAPKVTTQLRNNVDLSVPQEFYSESQLFGPKPFLSTDWTEIGGVKKIDVGKDYESFGITNVDIEIKSAITPKIVIDFVDVRGATLFEQGSCSPYGLFFNLPYPMFELTVKGYYGRPVKYYLNLVKFNTSFNSDTGNMESRAEFIGWSFAFLSDVLMGYLNAIPKLNENNYNVQQKLKKIYNDTWDYYVTNGLESGENPFCSDQSNGGRCLTIPDLVNLIKKLNEKVLPDIKISDEYRTLENLNSFYEKYKEYSDLIINLVNTLNEKKLNVQKSEKSNKIEKFFIPQTPKTNASNLKNNITSISEGLSLTLISNDVQQENNEINNILRDYFKKESGGKFADIVKTMIDIKTQDPALLDLLSDIQVAFTVGDKESVGVNLFDSIDEKWQDGALSFLGYKSYDNPNLLTSRYIDIGYLTTDAEVTIAKIKDKLDTLRKSTIDIIDQTLVSVLGFKPSIRNIFTILLCNTESFIEILKDVAIKSQQYHNEQSYDNDERITGNADEGNKKIVYSWPTFSEKPIGSTAWKEKFPGDEPKYRSWYECRFVVDFIDAYRKAQDQLESDIREDKVGLDQYVPITTIESPANPGDFNPIIYSDCEPDNLPKIIGERAFVSMDHNFFQPSRLPKDNGLPIKNNSWSPFVTKEGSKTNLHKKLGEIDAWNLLNSLRSSSDVNKFTGKILSTNSVDGFITSVKEALNISKNSTDGVIKYRPKDGISLFSDSTTNQVKIYADPNKMLDGDYLFKIYDKTRFDDVTGFDFDEEKSPEFTDSRNQYSTIIKNTFPTRPTEDLAGEFKIENNIYLDDKFNIPTNDDSRVFININPTVVNTPKPTEWWSSKDIMKLHSGWLTYFTVIKDDTLKPDELRPISIKEDSGFVGSFVLDGDEFRYEKMIDPFITTPSWLDNVNNFRKKVGGTDLEVGKTGYSTESIERRNLAYLFLHLLKPSPLVMRYINSGNYYLSQKSEFFSIKNFNITGGLTKAPKAWVLAIGAQLWRWKTFVGTDNNGKWNRPLKGNQPSGFDPLSQPGFNNSKTGVFKKPFRNDFEKYLTKIYGTKTWGDSVQKSVFANNYKNIEFGYYNGKNYFGFDYYATYDQILGEPNYGDKWEKLPGDRLKNSVVNYSWPTLWIAPHHIPYTSPSIFWDSDQSINSNDAYILLDESRQGLTDYQTLMPLLRGGVSDYTETDQPGTVKRNRSLDGDLGYIIQNLPDKIKEEFVKTFEDWCDSDQWKETLSIIDPVNFGKTNALVESYTFSVDSNFTDESSDLALVLDNRKSQVTQVVQKLLKEEYWIINSTPKIWYGIENFGDDFVCEETQFDEYLERFYLTIALNKESRVNQLDKQESKDTNVLEDSDISSSDLKLSIYRTFKSLTDKWIASSTDGNLFFNYSGGDKCSKGLFKSPSEKQQEFETANVSEKKENNSEGSRPLAAHFHYVNRTMGDIGGTAVLNPEKLLDNNVKKSLYQYMTEVLTDNEYMFFPLPSFVNFTANGLDKEDLEDMFRPVMTLENVSCGPLFLCMYVGGNSKHLNLKTTSNCKADIIDVNFKDDGTTSQDIANEINTGEKTAGFTAFTIRYGLENQNHFKNIKLDQSEFSETAESLLVIDKLSNQNGTDQTTNGQNLNSIYLTRSYTCEIESFGNPMIQPLTYFDLQGVPMFNGAYLITEVRHSFKPNSSNTSFKGVRQPLTTIPVVTNPIIAMKLKLNTDGSGKSTERVNLTTKYNLSGKAIPLTGIAEKISKNARPTIDKIIDTAVGLGIKDKNRLIALLTVAKAETGDFVPKNEKFFYSPQRFRSVFPTRTNGVPDSRLKTILPKSKSCTDCTGTEELAANFVYGGQYKTPPNEGYKYRGRGLTQITFKSNYETATNNMAEYFKVDLVNNPEKANDIDVAVKMLVILKIKGQFGAKLDVNVNYLDQVYNIISMQDGGAKPIQKKNAEVLQVYANALSTIKNDPYIQERLNQYPDFGVPNIPPSNVVRYGNGLNQTITN